LLINGRDEGISDPYNHYLVVLSDYVWAIDGMTGRAHFENDMMKNVLNERGRTMLD
jgi:hypothetical protein